MSSILAKLKPEEILLLNIIPLPDGNRKIIKDLITEVEDWDNFIRMANKHGVIALVYHNIEKSNLFSSVPPEIHNTLKTLYFKSLARNTFLVEKFTELQKNLESISIKPVVLKGMALEPTVYGNKGLRQMNDIDIYIADKDDCLRAWKHLISMGYNSRPQKSALYNDLLLDYGKHLPDLYKDGISYDLHFKLFENDYPVDTLAVSSGKVNLLIPAHNIHFLYLVKHLDDHERIGGSQLRLYLDLVQILKTTGIDPAHMIEPAAKLSLRSVLLEKLFLLNLFWSVPVEKTITDQLTDKQKTKAAESFLAFLRNPKGNTGRNKGTSYRRTLKTVPGLKKKIIFLLGDIFPSVSFMQTRYKTRTRAGACLYYPLRLGKLLLLVKK